MWKAEAKLKYPYKTTASAAVEFNNVEPRMSMCAQLTKSIRRLSR